MKLGTKVGLGPGQIVLDGDSVPPSQGNAAPTFRPTHCGQMAGLIKMPLGTEVCLGPAHIVLYGDPAVPQKKAQQPPLFAHVLWPNACMDQDATWYGGRPRPRTHCVRWGPSSPHPKKGAQQPPILGPCLLWPNDWMDQDATW